MLIQFLDPEPDDSRGSCSSKHVTDVVRNGDEIMCVKFCRVASEVIIATRPELGVLLREMLG
jgi:hypothetical protein